MLYKSPMAGRARASRWHAHHVALANEATLMSSSQRLGCTIQLLPVISLLKLPVLFYSFSQCTCNHIRRMG